MRNITWKVEQMLMGEFDLTCLAISNPQHRSPPNPSAGGNHGLIRGHGAVALCWFSEDRPFMGWHHGLEPEISS